MIRQTIEVLKGLSPGIFTADTLLNTATHFLNGINVFNQKNMQDQGRVKGGENIVKVQRYDRMLKKDSAVFLTVTAPITRPGVFPYQRAAGNVQYEAKLPDDVFSDLAIDSAKAKPVTDGHPNEAVTIDNSNRYSKGMTHTDSRVQGNKLVVSMTITDAALMDRIFSGEQSEISISFMIDIVEQRGTYQGDEYRYVQKNIDINHVAIVDKERAGPEVAIRADSEAWTSY